MFDGGELTLKENLSVSKKLFERCAKIGIILEVEIGVVGGEEDGKNNEGVATERLYTTPEEMLETYNTLNQVEGRFLLAATFGNVHGVYKPGAVKLRPDILKKQGQDAVQAQTKQQNTLDLVFHGGSGSSIEDIHETLEYGMIKMNIDTDNQYIFSRAVAHHMFTKYSEVLKIDGEVGVKNNTTPVLGLKLE